MASIKKYLDAIKAAVYGEEVRGSIHDAIKAIYDIATGAQGSATASANTAIVKASEAVAAAKEATAKAEEAIEAAEQAQISAENAEAATGVGIASQKKAGLVKGGENYIDESGELQLTKRTDFPTLYNSYAGGIKLNELGGASEQDSTTGAQLFDASNNYVGGNGTTVNLSQDSKKITISGTAPYAKVTFTVRSVILDKIKGTTITLSGIIKSKTVSTTVVAIQLVVTNADDTKTYNGVLSGSATPVAIPEDAKNVVVDLLVNNTSTALSTTNTVVFEDIMLNAGSTALPWEPFTGNAASPSLEYPQEIKPVEGKNLLDCRGLVEQTVNGGKFTPVYDDNGNLLYIEVDGTFTARSAYLLNRIATSEECIVSGAPTNGRIQVTSADTQYNDYGSGTTIPSGFEGSAYIIVDANRTLTNLKFYPMIRPASIADDTYVPYGLLRFWGHGKNWWNNYLLENGSINSTTGETTIQTNQRVRNRNFVPLCKGDWVISNRAGKQVVVYVYTLDDVFIPNESHVNWQNVPFAFNLSEHRKVKFGFRNSDDSKIEVTDVADIQLEAGTEATPYEPYTSQSITLSKPIKLNGVGTSQDKFVRKDGVWKVERNIPEVVFDGSDDENWQRNSISDTKIAYYIPFENLLNPNSGVKYNMLCTHAVVTTIYNIYNNQEEGCGISDAGNFSIYDDLYSEMTLYEFKEHLAEDPITVKYEVAQPTYEDLSTADQIALNSLVSYDGITYLYCDSEVQPTWDLEYGTSRVGGYVLETWNDKKNDRIRIEAMEKLQASLATALVVGSEV